MGGHFGEFRKDIRHVVYYQLSPYELKAFKGFFSDGFPNILRRVKNNLFFVGVPALMAYSLVEWANKANYDFNRKNPADFENDV